MSRTISCLVIVSASLVLVACSSGPTNSEEMPDAGGNDNSAHDTRGDGGLETLADLVDTAEADVFNDLSVGELDTDLPDQEGDHVDDLGGELDAQQHDLAETLHETHSDTEGELLVPECTLDEECKDMEHSPCEQATCNTEAGLCEAAPIPGCVPCDTVAQCPVPPACFEAACSAGMCVQAASEEGTLCDDLDGCTTVDTCVEGVCHGSEPVQCAPLSECHVAGVCDPSSGQCTNPQAQAGTPCEDGDLCTLQDSCQAGLCLAGPPMVCQDDLQCTADSCVEGQCQFLPIPDCVPEDCGDDVDNNSNGLIDCDDPLCLEAPECALLALGETCGMPYLVNEGNPVGAAAVGLKWQAQGDTTGKSSDYPPLCWQSTQVPDEVFMLEVLDPLRLRVSFHFTSPDETKFSRIMVFKDVCFPDNMVACAFGGVDPAEYENVFMPGVYYFVVTGNSFYGGDYGTYDFSVEVYTVDATETACQDGVDNDGNGLADCADPQCYEEPGCEELPLMATLQCGDTFSGTFLSLDESHYFAFTLDQPGNVAVYWAFDEEAKDFGYINFYEAMTDPPRYDELWGTGEMVWHGETGAGFPAKANRTYVAMFELSKLDQGDYNFTLACATVPEFNCGDGLDNDADSYADCQDPDCFDTQPCNGGFSGDGCDTAIPLNGGLPVTAVDIGTQGLSFALMGRNDTKSDQVAAQCAPHSSSGPDVVYTFTLDDYAEVTAYAQFTDAMLEVPAIYLFSQSCSPESLLGCGESMLIITSMSQVLGPGTYYLVVDSGGKSFSGVPFQGPFLLEIDFDPPPVPEICGNGDDDDGDGRIDCVDPECFADSSCVGSNSGEHCADAFRINGGDPLPDGYSTTFYNTTIGKDDNLGFSCAPATFDGPDTVHYFKLDEAKEVTIRLQFDDGFTPALVLFQGGCFVANIVHCEVAQWDTVLLTDLPLDSGYYHLMVDSGDELFGKPQANHYELTITTPQ